LIFSIAIPLGKRVFHPHIVILMRGQRALWP
jgi:hypothetical protein